MGKRIFDIFFSVTGILVVLPLLLILFFLVVIESRGGFLYFQKRVGRNGIDFKLYKIRTMYKNADQKGLLTVGDDDKRITPVGRILRAYKIDELPQLFNILSGKMSFVGPRPEVRKYVDMYTVEQKKVLSAKPGLTDYASLLYYNENKLMARYENFEEVYIKTIMPRKLRLNLIYIDNKNMCLDVKIILKTIFKWVR
ncbi:MAG TPA: sugar transferase [Bacteroidales bacterium]|nr:sugar transferase [Bacteroidales bacterium]